MKMVTYFNRTDLVKFGQYLLSKERREKFASSCISGLSLDERLAMVHHADVENWLDKGNRPKEGRSSANLQQQGLKNLHDAIWPEKQATKVTVKDLIREGMVIDPLNEAIIQKELDDFFDEEANAKYERDNPEEIKRTDKLIRDVAEKYSKDNDKKR